MRIRKCDVKTIECSVIERALMIAETYKYSYFDSLIIASALEHHCRTLYSEDLQHGQIIEGTLTIQNPFVVF
jgi:predicted nucleic acid-binding protein